MNKSLGYFVTYLQSTVQLVVTAKLGTVVTVPGATPAYTKQNRLKFEEILRHKSSVMFSCRQR
jgi:hypothetical protein